jgi:hypothetical protein
MKRIYKLFCVCLLALPMMVMAQKTYPTTEKFTFSGGNNMPSTPIGNDCGSNDITVTMDAIDGNMNVVVNKVCHSWSFVQDWMGNAWAPSIVFVNRFIEIRVQSDAVHAPGTENISFQCSGGNPNGSVGKSIPAVTYGIDAATDWEIKFFKLGGNCDTIFKEIDFNFENGNFTFDYAYFGDAAVPPTPTIDAVKDKNVAECAGLQTVNLTGIAIPGRLYDGLQISAESKSDGFLSDISIMDLGGGTFIDETSGSATLQYSPVDGMAGNSDSIIVTLKDTIRSTTARMAFKVNILAANASCSGQSLANISNKVSLYPSVTSDITTVTFPQAVSGNITVVDLLGKIVSTQKVSAQDKTDVNLSGLASGYSCTAGKSLTNGERRRLTPRSDG